MPSIETIQHISQIGFVGGLILFILLLYTGKLRWGSDYDELKKERDRYFRAALKGTKIASHAVRVVDGNETEKARGIGDERDEENSDD